MKAVIDLDYIKYAAASAGEKRTIKVIHKTSGREIECKTRTEFWGHWLKKNGGVLAEINKSRETPFVPEDFDIVDVQTPEPIENVLHSAKVMVNKVLHVTGATDHIAFMGKGDSFRVERSTILKYKGNRENMLRPIHLEEVSDYLTRKFNVEIVTDIEADDACVIEAYRQKDKFVIAIDKDAKGNDILLYNPNKESQGIIDCSGFGSLWLNSKKEVDGIGRSFLYYQVANGDTSDNYFANSASSVSWGAMSAYNSLVEATNDREAWIALVKMYKHLYPSPTEIVGWRGNQITVDWKYVLQENFDMARMLRWEGDTVEVLDVLNKLKVPYDDL